MKILPFWGSLALAAIVNAQYFSAGWAPGQSPQKNKPSATSPPPEATSSPAPAPSGGSMFDMKNLLSLPPVVSLLSRFGVNVTERLDKAMANNQYWDSRIPLVTDDNYGDLIVNETLTTSEEKERMWFIVISVTASQPEGISKYLDEVFDSAYNTTVIAGDLPGVRWGRIDYLNVTTITTKWAIWQAPYLVFVTDRGQTLRFLQGNRLRLSADAMRKFLKEEAWKTLEPWSSAYAPGGSREWIMDYFAITLTKIYNVFVMIPKWALFILSGGLGSVIIGLLHRNPANAKAVKQTKTAVSSVQPPTTPAPSQSSKRTETKQRKTRKK